VSCDRCRDQADTSTHHFYDDHDADVHADHTEGHHTDDVGHHHHRDDADGHGSRLHLYRGGRADGIDTHNDGDADGYTDRDNGHDASAIKRRTGPGRRLLDQRQRRRHRRGHLDHRGHHHKR
jgi:hypothetical protein